MEIAHGANLSSSKLSPYDVEFSELQEMSNLNWSVEISDDTGFLGLIDPASYQTFIDENWTYEQIIEHFKEQMQLRRLLIWETGFEGFWRVCVEIGSSKPTAGFRSVTGPIIASTGQLLLVNYETLTMAAQYEDVTLPEKHLEHCRIGIEPGSYECQITQMFNPESHDQNDDGDLDFILQLRRADQLSNYWLGIPWAKS